LVNWHTYYFQPFRVIQNLKPYKTLFVAQIRDVHIIAYFFRKWQPTFVILQLTFTNLLFNLIPFLVFLTVMHTATQSFWTVLHSKICYKVSKSVEMHIFTCIFNHFSYLLWIILVELNRGQDDIFLVLLFFIFSVINESSSFQWLCISPL
jgi:hypothetical protein